MLSTYSRFTIALWFTLASGCAVRRPEYVSVPGAQSRSEEPVALPLDSAGRGRLEAFLSRGGNPAAPDPIADPRAAEHARMLDALSRSDNLVVSTVQPTAREFCQVAKKLCAKTALFQGKRLVRQVVDARESRRPVPAPLAVPDGPFWWIFRLRDGRLAAVLLVCKIRRAVER